MENSNDTHSDQQKNGFLVSFEQLANLKFQITKEQQKYFAIDEYANKVSDKELEISFSNIIPTELIDHFILDCFGVPPDDYDSRTETGFSREGYLTELYVSGHYEFSYEECLDAIKRAHKYWNQFKELV